jgi:hypothetical protein
MSTYDNSKSAQASSPLSLASHCRVSFPLVRCLFALMVRGFAALGLIRKASALIMLLCCLWISKSTDSATPMFSKLITSVYLSIGISGIFLFTSMTALRDIRSLVHERVMNSVGGIEQTNQQ